jgi:hypothetical protein
VRPLAGAIGSTPPRSTDADGTPGMYTAGSCNAGFKTFYPGSRLVYALTLNASVPLGGSLRLSTCGLTTNDTVLYVGTGCPSWALPFGCLAGNNDAACSSNGLASALTIVASQRSYFIQVGGASGREVTAGLQWAYSAPAPVASRSASATRTRTRTRTRSRTRSASGMRSRSRSPKARSRGL